MSTYRDELAFGSRDGDRAITRRWSEICENRWHPASGRSSRRAPPADAPRPRRRAGEPANEEIIVPFAAGGPSDAMARLIAQGLGDQIGARVLVENVAGAGGTIGSARVSRAEPDGHTLLFGNIGTHAANVGLYKSLPYDPQADFEPVMLVASVPFVVAARRGLPADSFARFRALASAKPGELNYGSAGIGSALHLACLLLDAAMGAKARHIPY